MLGYAPGEIAPTQRAWDALIHPEDLADNDDAYARHARGETEVYAHEYRIRARDGSWRWMAERGRIVERAPDGTPLRMLGTQTDITERRRAQGVAIELAERLNKIAGHVPGMVFQYQRLADGSARFAVRQRALPRADRRRAGVLMHDAAAMLRRVERAERDGVLASIAESRAHAAAVARRTSACTTRGAGPRWLRGSATPQRAGDGSTLWHGYIEDVSELHELEQARFARTVAEAANRAKSEFLSRVSHELRTPLNAVLGFAQLMQLSTADPPSEQQQRRLALIREAGEHLLHMIGDLLDLTQFDAGRLRLEPTRVELSALLRECADMLRPQADAAAVQIDLDARGAGLAALGRSTAPEAGACQPRLQRREVQPPRRLGPPERRAARRRRVRAHRRQRHRHHARASGSPVRALRPARPGARRDRRHRARPGAEPRPRRGDGRPHRGAERPGHGLDLQRRAVSRGRHRLIPICDRSH